MKREVKHMTEVSGLNAVGAVRQIPFGGFVSTRNMVQFTPGTFSKVPGVHPVPVGIVPNSDIDAYTIATFARMKVPGVHGSASLRNVAVLENADKLQPVNLDLGLPFVAGGGAATLAQHVGSIGLNSLVFYADQTLFASQQNAIKRFTTEIFYEDMPGTGIPQGYLMQPFYDRLYVAGTLDASGVEEPFVWFSDVLSNNFPALNFVNTAEIPGPVTALAVNASSTDTSGIDTDLLIFKESSLFVYNEVRKDVLTESVGVSTEFYKAISNTTAGVMFFGQSKGLKSVFWIPFGQPRQPIDVGQILLDIFNSLAEPVRFAFSFFDGQFYRLHFGPEANKTKYEVWIDMNELAATQKPVWYGLHQRGDFSAGFIYPESGLVQLIRPGVKGRESDANGAFKRWFRETNAQLEPFYVPRYAFTDVNELPLISVLDVPLNMEPLEDKKTFALLEMQVTEDANLPNGAVEVHVVAEGVALDTQSVSIYDAKAKNANFVQISLAAQGHVGTTARDMRVRIMHNKNEEFALEGMSLQYERPEDTRLRSKIRS